MRRLLARLVRAGTIAGLVAAVLLELALAVAVAGRAKAKAPRAAIDQRPARDAGAVLRAMEANDAGRAVKPWVEDGKAYADGHAGRWVVGRSGNACATQAEALAAARADAARALQAIIARDGAAVARRVGQSVLGGDWEADREVERFERPYGTVWAGYVLVDASVQKVAAVQREYAAEVRRREIRARAFGVIGAVVVAGAWLGCAVMDWATRGFFTRRLRAGALGVTVVAIVAVALAVVAV